MLLGWPIQARLDLGVDGSWVKDCWWWKTRPLVLLSPMSSPPPDVRIYQLGPTVGIKGWLPPHRSSYWSDNCWRETDPTTSHINTFQGINSPPKGLTSKKTLKPLPSFRACQRVGRYSAQHLPTTIQSWIWTKRSDKPTTRLSRSDKPADRENKPKELVKTPINRERGKTDNGWSRGIVDQVSSTHIAKWPVTMFQTVGL